MSTAPAGREVAHRLLAAEFDDATLEHSDSDEERAPNYVVTPTGVRANRLFVVGVLTEVDAVGDGILRGRVADPTGAFVLYAGQYQPDAAAFLEAASIPSFVAVTGKARTFQPEGSDRIFTSIRPESINETDAAGRDRWTVQAAEHTLDRIAVMAAAKARDERGDELRDALLEDAVEPGLAAGIPLAIDHYNTTTAYLEALRATALDALRVVAGDREEVVPHDLAPDEGEDGAVALEWEPGDTGAGVVQAIGGATVQPDAGGSDDTTGTTAESAEPSAPPRDGGEETADEPPEPAAAGGTAERDGSSAAPPSDTSGAVAPAEGPESDELYEFDEGERERIEEEFGAEFATGAELDAADDTPETSESDDDAQPPTEADAAGDQPEDEPDDGDLLEAVVGAMRELDDGDGAGYAAVVEAVAASRDVDDAAVEEAIQDALMSGQCYEPEDDRLKAI